MRIYLKNNRVKFHPDPIWNDEALDFFEERRPNKKNKDNKMCSHMISFSWSVPDPKTVETD